MAVLSQSRYKRDSNGKQDSIPGKTTRGTTPFDNNKEVIERTINRIVGNTPEATPKFPVEDLNC